MAKFPPPENFDFTRPELWPEWRQRFKRFRIATKLHKETEEVQVCTLLYSLGKEAEHVFKTFSFAEEGDENKYEAVLEKLDNYFVPKVNVIHERARFYQRIQKHGERAKEYIRSLHEIAETCSFGGNKNENIRDRLVVGILDKELSEKLQLTSDLTLDKAVELVRHSEQVKGHVSEQGACASSSTQLDEVAKRGQRPAANTERRYDQQQKVGAKLTYERRGRMCYRCGKFHAREDRCPARNAECHSCKKLGHFAAVCRSYIVNEVSTHAEGNEQTPREHYLGAITQVTDSNDAWTVKLPILGVLVNFKIDTGADTSVISEKTFSLMNKPKLRKFETVLDSPGGRLSCLGYFIANAKQKQKQFRFKVHVLSGDGSHLLGRNVAVAMGLVKRIAEIKQQKALQPTEVGTLNVKPVKITLKEGAVPYSVTTARRVSVPMLSKVKDELDRMVASGVITEIKEPTEWCAAMVPVPKKNKKQIRICVDLKKLNKAVKREKFILPTIDDILPKLAHAKVFSLLDAASGFWQIPLEPESAKLTTFITPFGRYFF